MNIAYGSNVIYNSKVLTDCKGINLNWLGSIRTPRIDDINGILNLLCVIGILVERIYPLFIWHWGTVGDIIGSNVPLVKFGVNNELNPKLAELIVYVLAIGSEFESVCITPTNDPLGWTWYGTGLFGWKFIGFPEFSWTFGFSAI